MQGTSFLTFVWFLLLQASLVCFAVSVKNITRDQTALLALKAHVNDPESILAKNWSTSSPVCSWIGVICGVRHHRVRSLNLSHMGLSGILPSEMGNLSFLAFLSIRNNGFSGSLPEEVAHLRRLKLLDLGLNLFKGNIPPSIGSLSRLESLLLETNNFEGNFPSFICNISSLQRMDISHNQLSGSIPSSIRNCSLLTGVDFSENSLTGAIPYEIGDFSNLETVRINSNALNGSIPSSLFNISTLKVLAMHANHLSGSLPSAVGISLPNLMELLLGGNEINGTMPSTISNASKLIYLDLSDNSFTGFIPNTLGNLRHLQRLNLANNHLKCESPRSSFFSSLTKCKNLRKLVLSGNKLNVTLPISIGNLSTSLEQLWANNCFNEGSIPTEVGNLTSLIALGLANNGLTGTIPATIGRLEKLQGLYLQVNKLEGFIPYNLCHLDRLFNLSLGGNQISGSIPDCLHNLTTLGSLDLGSNSLTSIIPSSLWSLEDILCINLSSNYLSGSLSFDMGILRVVGEIDFSRNRLSGEIPNSIVGLESLTYLSLAYNRLQGPIPDSIGALRCLTYISLAHNRLQGPIPESINGSISLELLEISFNNLSGVIPKSLEALSYLKYFNVSFNGLEGEVPNQGPFRNFLAQSYVMNKALCGAPQLQVLTCKKISQKQARVKIIKISSFVSVALVILVSFALIWSWRKSKKPRQEMQNTMEANRRLTYLELEQATDGFSQNHPLGIGNFASVYKGTLRNGMVVAIKVFNVEEERSFKSFDVEREALVDVVHQNIIKVLCISNSANFKALVMEYVSQGSLDKWLHTHNYHLDILQRLDIMIDTASAIKYLHYDCPMPVIHCDLKPSNILIDEDMRARVCDFGIAKIIDPSTESCTRQSAIMCTFGYAAPELGLHGIVSRETDVYSFGILLMETFTGKRPTDEMFGEDMNLRNPLKL